jgi:hypothetical protein
LFFGILFWGYSAPTLHTGDASIYPHDVVIFHALRPNNKNPIHEQQAFFQRAQFLFSEILKSHDIVVYSNKKQEHQGAAVGIGQRWNVYNSDIILPSQDNQRLVVTHTHTHRE